jgi:P-aminobenzoate N-oxygenase AurF
VTTQPTLDPIAETLNKLVVDSTEHYYNPYTRFTWPEELAVDGWWMSPDLLTVAGTPWAESLDEPALRRLSKWECINFFSLNIHGIRELLMEVTRRIHTPGFELPSEFFHRFLGEENGHMWFFAQFCRRYGGKIYPDRSAPFAGEGTTDSEVASFLVFTRILIFEELVDHFNIRMGRDQTLLPVVRELNQAHHDDEWRHIVMGRKLVDQYYRPPRERDDRALLDWLDEYLRQYLVSSIQSLYNPVAYRDAGLPDPYKLRAEVLNHPARVSYHRTFMRRITGFLEGLGIISASPFEA